MSFAPGARRFWLALHVTVSVGFAGAVAAFLALALVGLSAEAIAARGIYIAMDLITDLLILPLCIAALVTGVITSIGTPWGLVRYWWVVVKLAITLLSTAVLFLHMRPIDVMASTTPSAETAGMQAQLASAAGAALVALIFMTVISIYKPRGLTAWGARGSVSS